MLYTDGVIDTVGEDDRFGEERLAATVQDGDSAADTVARIERAVQDFGVGAQVDDIALIVVERTERLRLESGRRGTHRLEEGRDDRAVPGRWVDSTMRGIRRREEIAWNLEHISHMIKAASWLSSMDLPVRLICIPEGGLQGFTDEVLDLDHETYARECAIDIPGPETDYLGRLAQQWNAYVIAQAKARHPEFPGRFFNVGFVIEPEDGTVILRHHKLVPLLPVEHSVPRTTCGIAGSSCTAGARRVLPGRRHRDRADRIMMANEASYPENARGLAMNGCEIAYRGRTRRPA